MSYNHIAHPFNPKFYSIEVAYVFHKETMNCFYGNLCLISETWLQLVISKSLICPPGFYIARKDWQDIRGGGVAIL